MGEWEELVSSSINRGMGQREDSQEKDLRVFTKVLEKNRAVKAEKISGSVMSL